jgi:hypothetical protein
LITVLFSAIIVTRFSKRIPFTSKVGSFIASQNLKFASLSGFVAQISIIWDSCHESSVIAGVYEQLDTYDVQDPELGRV